LAVAVSTLEYQVGALCRLDLCVLAVMLDHQIGRAPDFKFKDHRGIPSALFST